MTSLVSMYQKEYSKNTLDIKANIDTMKSTKDFNRIDKLLQANQDCLNNIKSELKSLDKTKTAQINYPRLKEEYDGLRKKFRKIKNERLANENVFTLDDTDNKIDEPLLSKEGQDQERRINNKLVNMGKTGREAEMVATDTIGELYRNKGVLEGTSARVSIFLTSDQKTQRCAVRIEKTHD